MTIAETKLTEHLGNDLEERLCNCLKVNRSNESHSLRIHGGLLKQAILGEGLFLLFD